ncbi:putative transporter [Escovopsis weberi]|uniref:Putative transporter n=1 Tax=Escovopsis weberi TaxID=150374 RepID=A0A0M8MWB1_ESCWE|nr:putative transporter [Escovopsis weberi]
MEHSHPSDNEKTTGSPDGEKTLVITGVDQIGGAQIEPQQTNTSTHTYPEGGLRAWLVVLGAWLAMISAMGLMNSIAIFQAYTVKHQLSQYSEGTIGWIFSLYTFLAFFGGVYIGPIFDKYGPTWLLSLGVLLTAGGLISMSFCHELWQFILSFGILNGLGTSLIFTPCVAAVGHWFKARRGLATGLASSAGGFGGIIFPLMLTSLFDRIGFGWSVRVLALICLSCGIPGVILVRSRLPPIDNASAHPDFRIFKQVPFLLTTIGLFLIEFSLFIPLAYISTYAQYRGFDQTFAFQLLPIMNAGSVIGRALPGYYADVVGPFNVCCFSSVVSLVACLVVWLPLGHTKPGIIVFSLVFGFSSGTAIAIAPVCIGRLCKTQMYGRYYATCYTVVSVACLIGIPIAGAILSSEGGSYTGLIIFTGAVYVLAVLVMIAAKVCHLGWGKLLAAY